MKKILIIEDESSIAELEKCYLEANGYLVDIENDGHSGLQRALSDSYDLIILDIMLPEIDGFKVCKKIREVKDIPILMISAKKEDVDKVIGFGFGADDYLTKPFSFSEFVARVNAHISRYRRIKGKSEGSDIFNIRGLQIDRSSRRVYVNGKEVILTIKEFELLAFLSSNPEKVFTREELFCNIWGMNPLGDNATVTVHINKLRDKIEQDQSDTQYIETLWGAGYRFKI